MDYPGSNPASSEDYIDESGEQFCYPWKKMINTPEEGQQSEDCQQHDKTNLVKTILQIFLT